MYYVYLLRSSKNGKYYIGQTSNLRLRFSEHNRGLNQSSKSGVKWKLVYYEAYPTRQEAIVRERKLKHHGKGLSEIKRRLTSLVDD